MWPELRQTFDEFQSSGPKKNGPDGVVPSLIHLAHGESVKKMKIERVSRSNKSRSGPHLPGIEFSDRSKRWPDENGSPYLVIV